jgi:hypothetical protein
VGAGGAVEVDCAGMLAVAVSAHGRRRARALCATATSSCCRWGVRKGVGFSYVKVLIYLSLTSAVHFVVSSITASCTNCIDRHIDTWFKAFKYQLIKILLQAIKVIYHNILSGFASVTTWSCWTRKQRRNSNRVQNMMDSLFTIAIMQFHLILPWTNGDVEQEKKIRLKSITRYVPLILLRNTFHYRPCNKYNSQSEFAEISSIKWNFLELNQQK